MDVGIHTFGDAHNTPEGGLNPPYIGLTPDVLPEVQEPAVAESLHIGVSTQYIQSGTTFLTMKRREKELHWYALRATYGQGKKAYDYLVSQNVEAYYPTIKAFKMVDGKRRKVEEARLPNLLFARGTEMGIKAHVYDNINLPYLRFYYRHFFMGRETVKEPLIVPDRQMESLKIICAAEDGDNVIVPPGEYKFEQGDTVRVTGGSFKGVVGKVARYCGQLRVAVIIDGLLTIATAYIPRGYLEKIKE